MLQISSKRNVEKEDKNNRWHRVKRSSGKFTRSFRLPDNAKMEQVKASMENGVITVTVPKVDVKKSNVKAIVKFLVDYPKKKKKNCNILTMLVSIRIMVAKECGIISLEYESFYLVCIYY